MAQTILDMFPDSVNQFGLLGCGAFILPWAMAAAYIGSYISWFVRSR